MKLITLRGKGIRTGVAFAAVVVPDTDDLLAVDERHPADPKDVEDPDPDWRITHIPTMFAVWKPGLTDASTMERAIQIAQSFYREAKALGWNLRSENEREIVGAHNAMPKEERERFWKRVTEEVVLT